MPLVCTRGQMTRMIRFAAKNVSLTTFFFSNKCTRGGYTSKRGRDERKLNHKSRTGNDGTQPKSLHPFMGEVNSFLIQVWRGTYPCSYLACSYSPKLCIRMETIAIEAHASFGERSKYVHPIACTSRSTQKSPHLSHTLLSYYGNTMLHPCARWKAIHP